MRIREAVLFTAFAFHSVPAMAQKGLDTQTRQPKAIAAFVVQERHIELTAAGRYAKADTALRRAYVKECESMGKVLPGYPQQPFVSFDLRVKF